ncbi:hypothetical protein P5V15_010326 [Pogonomyrmex californicus]
MIVIRNFAGRATTICILATLLCLGSRVSGEYESREINSSGRANDGKTSDNDFRSCVESKCIKRTDINGMWFGPRLGKRHRTTQNEREETNPEVEALTNVLDGVRWAVVTIPAANDKRQSSQFTPRLGRGSGEDLYSYGDVIDRSEVDEDDRTLPLPIFAPHLGRRLWGPRLGRQLRSVLRKM